MTWTASAAPLAMICPPSVAYPRIASAGNAWTKAGTARHRYLRRCLEVGAEAALAEVPVEHLATCEALPVLELPASRPGEWAGEVALAFDAVNDAGLLLGQDLERAYPDLPPGVISGTADLVGLTPDEVWIADYKGPWDRADPAWQLKLLLVAACRYYGRSRGRAATIRLRDEECPPWRWIVLDDCDLELAAEELRELIAGRVPAAERAIAAGAVPPGLLTGDHCDRCPAWLSCDAQTRLIRHAAVGHESDELGLLLPLDARGVAIVWPRVKQVLAMAHRLDGACRAAAREIAERTGQPVPLPNGRLLGPVDSSRESIEGAVGYHVLKKLHGQEVAEAGVKFTMAKTGKGPCLESALRLTLRSPKDRLAPRVREALEAIRAAGGVKVKTTTTIREYGDKGAAVAGLLGDGDGQEAE